MTRVCPFSETWVVSYIYIWWHPFPKLIILEPGGSDSSWVCLDWPLVGWTMIGKGKYLGEKKSQRGAAALCGGQGRKRFLTLWGAHPDVSLTRLHVRCHISMRQGHARSDVLPNCPAVWAAPVWTQGETVRTFHTEKQKQKENLHKKKYFS
jgi:hypothetical protein